MIRQKSQSLRERTYLRFRISKFLEDVLNSSFCFDDFDNFGTWNSQLKEEQKLSYFCQKSQHSENRRFSSDIFCTRIFHKTFRNHCQKIRQIEWSSLLLRQKVNKLSRFFFFSNFQLFFCCIVTFNLCFLVLFYSIANFLNTN